MGSPVSALTTVPLSEGCCAAVRYAHTSQKGIVRSRQVALAASYPGDRNLVPVLNRRTKMPEERVELSWGCPRRILSPLRLPFRHSGRSQRAKYTYGNNMRPPRSNTWRPHSV